MHKHFIRLSCRVINTRHVVEIVKEKNRYLVHLTNNAFDGHIFFGSGSVGSDKNVLEICETRDKKDHDIITNLFFSANDHEFIYH